jgi:hypothetical protein
MDDRELVARSCATPWNYAKAKLGMNLTPKQAAVLKDWFVPGSRVACRCGNEVGKTSRLAVASILHHAEQLKGMVVSTAGVARQVKTQLIPNLQTVRTPLPGLEVSGGFASSTPRAELRYLGFTAANEGTFQGFHNLDGPLGIILDESAIIKDKLIIAAEERCNPTRFLMMGSPLDPTGQFYKNCTSQAKYYKQHKITQFDCPWISKEVIERRIEKYGPEHPIVLSSIYADFCLKVEGALLSLTGMGRVHRNSAATDWHRAACVPGLCGRAQQERDRRARGQPGLDRKGLAAERTRWQRSANSSRCSIAWQETSAPGHPAEAARGGGGRRRHGHSVHATH